jgi:hypothetical protein
MHRVQMHFVPGVYLNIRQNFHIEYFELNLIQHLILLNYIVFYRRSDTVSSHDYPSKLVYYYMNVTRRQNNFYIVWILEYK